MNSNPRQPKLSPAGMYGIGYSILPFVVLLSCLINLLMLTGPLFMMQVYDRVLSSQSLSTLVILVMIVVVLYAVQALLDGVKGRVSARLAANADTEIAPKVFDLAGQRARLMKREGDAQQPLRDLDTLRQFRAGGGPLAVLDLPWTPVYLCLISLFHPILGLIAVIGAVILMALTWAADRFSGGASQVVAEKTAQRNTAAECAMIDAEVLESLGILPRLRQSWAEAHQQMVLAQIKISDRAGGLQAIAKGFRFLLQSLTLAAGALLVIRGELSAGAMMATTVLSSRALAPIEGVIGQWRGYLAAKSACERLNSGLALLKETGSGVDLAPPEERVDIENMMVAAPGENQALLSGVTLQLRAGQGLGVIGPSGAGKTTFLRGLLGLWPVSDGALRFDGATPDQWKDGTAGFAGYLPQDTRLLPGTVAQNIARFDPAATTEKVVGAARLAGVHDLILTLPGGYNAEIGASGTTLSAGQRQRIALARAVYGDPFLVVMDEPNANLDAQGDSALSACILALRKAGKIVICIAHRPSALASLDMVLMIEAGRMRSFGPRDEVLGQVTRYPRAVPQEAQA